MIPDPKEPKGSWKRWARKPAPLQLGDETTLKIRRPLGEDKMSSQKR